MKKDLLEKKKVLVISYMFPPVGGVGVIRTTKFVKYLSKFDYHPYILTVKKGFYPIIDQSLLEELPKDIQIDRVSYFQPGFWIDNRYWHYFLRAIYYLFLLPDHNILWFLPAFIRGYKIIKKEQIKLIFTSSSAYSDHLIALALKKVTGVKWVADFRDEWVANPGIKYPTFIHRTMATRMEQSVINGADHITAVSEPITDYFRDISRDKNKLSVITNGFDQDDLPLKNIYFKRKYCQILYAGTINGNAKKIASTFQDTINKLNLKNLKVVYLGKENRLAHKKAICEMARADILLLILSPDFRPGVYSGKLFEYLSVRRPILALANQETKAAEIIRKFKAGNVVNPLDATMIRKVVLEMYQNWQSDKLIIPYMDIDKFDRVNLTAKLAKLFDSLLVLPTTKIKICIIGNSPDSFHHQKFCQYLIQLGYEVHFIALKPGSIEGVKMYHTIPLGNFFMPIWAAKTLLRVKKIIRQIKPDIVHGQYLTIGGFLAYLSGFRPYTLTAWGSDILLYEQLNFAERMLLKRVINGSSFMTGDSRVLLDKSIKLGAKPRKYLDFIFGIDTNNFKKRSSEILRKELNLVNQKVVFCARSISPLYNIDILIDTFSLIAKKNKQVKLALLMDVRDQIYFEKIKEMIRALKLTNKVILLPKIVNNQMFKYYNLAEVVVSIPSSDSCSVSFLEAMACQCKIVLSDLPYLKEWLTIDDKTKHGNFWVAPINDKKELASNLQKALDFQPKTFKIIGENNRKLIQKKAEIMANFKKLDRAYQEILKKS